MYIISNVSYSIILFQCKRNRSRNILEMFQCTEILQYIIYINTNQIV